MPKLATIKQYIDIMNCADWDKLNNILIDNFHFKGRFIETWYLADYIEYNRNVSLPFHCKTKKLEQISEQLFRYKFEICIIDEKIYKINIDQLITIKGQHINQTVLFYDKNLIPKNLASKNMAYMEKIAKRN
ncbi:MAG: hypothetical protein HRU28_09550 [Rhizobiales bacterium]|nr:hypothetical protein [Hyphomicrobiales bacterium]